ncbi:MAG TPA: 2-amino-4-hydroxy-6-hydroxymethyldihydropteridine diphosphokinase [Candidatus Acidoferrales bacterium]
MALGSNIGDREQNTAQAIEALEAHGVQVLQRSALYETEPIDVRGRDWFLNSAIRAETNLMPLQLMHTLLQIERTLGRKRQPELAEPGKLKEPRTIDIDVLLLGDSVIHSPELEVPHPRMAERRFVLVPLAEIAAGVWHPVLKKTIAELLAVTSDRSQVRMYKQANMEQR